jgi:hypothetical protein
MKFLSDVDTASLLEAGGLFREEFNRLSKKKDNFNQTPYGK